MSNITDINYIELALSTLLLVAPILLVRYYKIKLTKPILISSVRMVIQLSLVAVYLEYIFKTNSAYLNILWVMVMVFVGVITTINRVGIKWKRFIYPLLLATISSIVIIDAFFLGIVLKLDYVFDARYFIPITGMILGNSLNHNIVGLSTYFKGLDEKSDLYYFMLTNSNSKKLAIRPFVNESIRSGLNPLIASMSVIGLISLPGMMTGQILGGSSPVTAIKYQIMIMIAIFVGSTLNLFLSILFSNKIIFDKYDNLIDLEMSKETN